MRCMTHTQQSASCRVGISERAFSDKTKIASLLNKNTKEKLLLTIQRYVEECKRDKVYMKNLSSFLNKIPEYDLTEKPKTVEISGYREFTKDNGGAMSRKIGNVLSLFDGMSCGRQALEKAEIKIGKYYASEIDKYAIQVAQHNYPNTIQLGSVTDVDVADLEPIDLLIGGSPCQSFSFAGKRNGMTTSCNEEIYSLERYLELKADGFQFEGESYLFWEYMRILTDIRKVQP